MLWEIIFLTGFLYCSGDTIIPLCSSDCTTEQVLAYQGDNVEFQGKYPSIVLAVSTHFCILLQRVRDIWYSWNLSLIKRLVLRQKMKNSFINRNIIDGGLGLADRHRDRQKIVLQEWL